METNRKLAISLNFVRVSSFFFKFSSGFVYWKSRRKAIPLFSDCLEKKMLYCMALKWRKDQFWQELSLPTASYQASIQRDILRKSTIASPQLWITLSIIEGLILSTQDFGYDAKSTCSIRTEKKADTSLYFFSPLHVPSADNMCERKWFWFPPFTAVHSNSFTKRFIYFPLKAALFRLSRGIPLDA